MVSEKILMVADKAARDHLQFIPMLVWFTGRFCLLHLEGDLQKNAPGTFLFPLYILLVIVREVGFRRFGLKWSQGGYWSCCGMYRMVLQSRSGDAVVAWMIRIWGESDHMRLSTLNFKCQAATCRLLLTHKCHQLSHHCYPLDSMWTLDSWYVFRKPCWYLNTMGIYWGPSPWSVVVRVLIPKFQLALCHRMPNSNHFKDPRDVMCAFFPHSSSEKTHHHTSSTSTKYIYFEKSHGEVCCRAPMTADVPGP